MGFNAVADLCITFVNHSLNDKLATTNITSHSWIHQSNLFTCMPFNKCSVGHILVRKQPSAHPEEPASPSWTGPRNVSSFSSCKSNILLVSLNCPIPQTNINKKPKTVSTVQQGLKMMSTEAENQIHSGHWWWKNAVRNLLLLNAKAQVCYMHMGVLPNRQKSRGGRTWQDFRYFLHMSAVTGC